MLSTAPGGGPPRTIRLDLGNQMASNRVSQMQRASKVIVALTLLLNGESLFSAWQPAAVSDQTETQSKLKALTEMAARFRMLIPTAEKRLVLAHTGSHSSLGKSSTSRDPAIYSPAFLLEESADSVVVLRGFTTETPKRRREASWREFSTEPVKPAYGGHAVRFGQISTFVCAVQLAASGDLETAAKLLERYESDNHFELVDGQSVEDLQDQPTALLALCIVDHLRQQILARPEDWKDTLLRMRSLLNDFPDLKTDTRAALLDDLTKTVFAKPPDRDSTEELLLIWSRTPSRLRHLGLYHTYDEAAADTTARTHVMQGFKAIPGLIALLNDRRVTVHESAAAMRAPARIQRVGELSEKLLIEIAGSRCPETVNRKTSAVWLAWWNKTQRIDPEEFFVSAVFTRENGRITREYESPARILAEHFPHRLAPLCEEFSEVAAENVPPCDLPEAVAGARLPRGERSRILSRFALKGSLAQKRWVLQALAKLDGPEAARILKTIFDRFPKDAREGYWTCPEAAYSHVVMQIEENGCWADYLRVAKRSSVGLRMEMMNPFNYAYIGDKCRSLRLAFLAAFLDDESERRIPPGRNQGKFDGPCAAFTFPQIQVRDFAAMKIASILDMDRHPDEFWTSENWRALREEVRSRLASEDLPPIDPKTH